MFMIDRDHLLVQEHVRFDFDHIRKNTVDLIEEAGKHFGIRLFRVEEIRLRALWPVPEEYRPISEVLTERALNISDDHFKFLGEVQSTPVEIVGDADDPPRHWHVRLDAGGEDAMFIQTETYFYSPLSDMSVVGEYLQLSYDFLTGNVPRFINSFMT
jgi:hypothetical protein